MFRIRGGTATLAKDADGQTYADLDGKQRSMNILPGASDLQERWSASYNLAKTLSELEFFAQNPSLSNPLTQLVERERELFLRSTAE